MAEAPLKWKVELLKEIRDGNAENFYAPKSKKEGEWFEDMKRDGLVCGKWATTITVEEAIKQNTPLPKGGQSGYFHLSVPTNGKKLIEDYEAKTTISGIWNRHHIGILKWIVGILAVVLVAILTREWHLK